MYINKYIFQIKCIYVSLVCLVIEEPNKINNFW